MTEMDLAMNVGTLWTARTFPDRLAISYGDYELTYREADERINRLANALRRLGIQKGSNLAILLHDCPPFIEGLFACFKAGIGSVPINFRLHPKECSFIIANSEAEAVILGEDFRDSLYALKKEMPRVKQFISIINPLEGMLRYEDLIKDQPSTFYCIGKPDFHQSSLAFIKKWNPPFPY
jgi:acyl-CoA synthetase (AMP-forming)/AMP-acid ligase II